MFGLWKKTGCRLAALMSSRGSEEIDFRIPGMERGGKKSGIEGGLGPIC